MDSNFAECSLTELCEDPLIGLMMKSDGVDRRSVELLFEQVARRRGHDVHGRRGREAATCPTR